MVHIAEVVLEWLDVTKVVGLGCIQLIDLLFHSTSFRNKILNNQIHVFVGPLEMNDFSVHTCNLFLHFGDFLLSRANVPLEFFDFVIQNKLKFLKLLSLLFQLVDSHHFVPNRFLPFFDFFGLGDFLLKVFFVFLLYFLNVFKSVLESMFLFL